jgi:hypothetical protein
MGGFGRVAQALFCSFLLTASIDESIRLLQYTGTLRSEGAPRVGFTRGGLRHAERFKTLLWSR